MTTTIELRHVTKRFGDFAANDDINLRFASGEVHALLGENGAGKSTMMNMLAGLLQPTSGEILIHGRAVHLRSAKDATTLGIGMVHQHFMLVQDFTVTENIILGDEPTHHGKLAHKQAEAAIQALSDRYQLHVEPAAMVADISVGMQQRVEILKVLYRGADLLIFDEPTAVLTPQEVQELLAILQQLAAEGKTVLLISHKLQEIKAVAAKTTIIRRGRVIQTLVTAEHSTGELADLMVGRPVSFERQRDKVALGPVVLAADTLNLRAKNGVAKLTDLSLQLRGGEILGIAGIDGNGQDELVKVLTGLAQPSSGQVQLGGRDVTHAPVRARTQAGLGHIPADRQREGLILGMDLVANATLQTYSQPPLSHHGIMQPSAMVKESEEMLAAFDVRYSQLSEKAGELSGGNQQKLILARELSREPQVVIAFNPTRGLDVGAIEFIHDQLLAVRASGRAVLLLSFELDEVRQLADRIAVIHGGRIIGEAAAADLSQQDLGLMMAGSLPTDEEV